MAIEKTDVLVIGGGLLGTSTAYHLAKEKVRVTVLEQNAVGTGTSFHGSGRVALPDHYVFPSELGRLVWTGSKLQMEMTPQIAEESGIDVLYQKRDQDLTIAVSEEAWSELQEVSRAKVKILTDMQAQGWGEVKLISGEDAHKVEPSLGREIEIYGAEYRSGVMAGAFVDPYRLTLAYAQLAHKYGAKTLTRTVTGLVKEGARVIGVQTGSGEQVLCENLVLTMGNWTPVAEEWFGVPLPVRAIKGQEIRLKCDHPPLASLNARGINVRPLTDPLITLRGDGVFTIGHTTQDTYHWDPPGDRQKPYFFDNTVEHHITKLILEYAIKLVPAFAEGRIVGAVAGPRPIPPDGLPTIGPVPRWEGAYVCVGNPGITSSYHWGQVMRDLVVGRPLDFSLEPFLPDRFEEGRPVPAVYGVMSFDVS